MEDFNKFSQHFLFSIEEKCSRYAEAVEKSCNTPLYHFGNNSGQGLHTEINIRIGCQNACQH